MSAQTSHFAVTEVTPQAVVRLERISRIYQQGQQGKPEQQQSVAVRALDDINLEILRGDFAVLVGPSGSGKTTLLNLIGALDTPSAGRIWIDGTEIGGMSKAEASEMRLRKIGFVFQEFNLIPVLSAVENVEFVMLLQGRGEVQRRSRAMALLAALGLEGMEQRRPAELSGGQQQRVAVARAIAAEPVIVLPDEPTANLDSKSGAALMDLMRKLNEEQGVTFVFSTHDAMVVERARRVITLRDGRIESDLRK